MAFDTLLANHFLVAMPKLVDTPFERSVIYICEHHTQGTVGLIINRPMKYPLSMVFEQLHIEKPRQDQGSLPLLYGGSVQPERGFVIHRPMGVWHSSLSLLADEVAVTTSKDIIQAIAENHGPKDALIALGYTGWGEKQLEEEVMKNIWLVCPFNSELMYDVPFTQRWEYAGHMIGVNMNQISSGEGHA